MRKNTKQIEIDEVKTLARTKIKMLVMKDGTRYFRQHDITHDRTETYPGEARNIVGIISAHFFWNKPDNSLKYARIWYDRSVYIHEDDIRSYILERQGNIENAEITCAVGRIPYWTVEAAAAIKAMFGIKVAANGKHERITAPKEIADQFEKNPKLRLLYKANQAMVKGYQTLRRQPTYWAQLVKAEEDLKAWKLQQA